MTDQNADDINDEDSAATIGTAEPESDAYTVYVDDAAHDFESPYQTAHAIMVAAGIDPDDTDEYLLYALEADDMPKDEEFEADDEVDLTEDNRRFFAIEDAGAEL